MGYNPFTHQVWVRIVGLPLQAWTATQVTAVIRKFGHPIHILPFGHEAGHFKDITALVATKSPNLIPLAYTYREGTYATRVDIHILNWRLWEEGYYPPPEDYPDLEARSSQSRNYEDPSLSLHSRHRYSPERIPSEPTMDWSAWSPRSHKLPSFFPNRPSLVSQSFTHSDPNVTALVVKITTPPPLPVCIRNCTRITEHAKRGDTATLDPTQYTNLPLICSLVHAFRLTIPNPVTINCLTFLQSIGCPNSILGKAPSNLSIQLRLFTPFLRQLRGTRNEDALGGSPASLNLNTTSPVWSMQHIGQATGPFRPNEENLVVALTGQTQHSQPTPFLPCLPPIHTRLALLESSWVEPLAPQPNMNRSEEQISSSKCNQPNPQAQSSVAEESPMTANSPGNATDNVLLSVTSHPTLAKRKERKLPTRRSKRLQAQQMKEYAEPNHTAKAPSHACKILFSDDSHMLALDTSKTMEILQATGLQITKQIEVLIEEAVKRDQEAQTSEQAAPTTPLHDPIPPLPIPGTDLFL